MRHAPCGYCPPVPAATEKAPLFLEGGRSPEAIRGEKNLKLPQSARSADSPLFVEGAFRYKQNGR